MVRHSRHNTSQLTDLGDKLNHIFVFKVQLQRCNPSSAFQSTSVTFFWVWTKRDSWGRARVCLHTRTVPSCDLVPNWQQSLLNWGPLSHKGSTGYTHSSHSAPDCRPPTAHLAHCYYVTVVCLCVCVSQRLCKSCRHHLLCPLWTFPRCLFFFFFFTAGVPVFPLCCLYSLISPSF